MKKIRFSWIGVSALFVLLFLGTMFYSAPTVSYALDPAQTACEGILQTGADCNSGDAGLGSTVKNIINILLYIVGVAAVIMMIVGGLRYVTSAGDQQAAAAARNTILYSLIGIVVAGMAFVLVNFVFNRVVNGSGTSSSGTTSNPPSNPPPNFSIQ